MAGLLVMTHGHAPHRDDQQFTAAVYPDLPVLHRLYHCRTRHARRWAPSLADARARGSYMGFSRLGLAFGGALVTRAAAGCLMPGKPSASPNCRG